MAFKYKIKEQERKNTLKPKDVSPNLLKRLEDLYGPIDVERDFFSADLDTYYKTKSVDKETGTVGHKVIPLASFEESLRKITSAYEALKDLLKADEAKNDSNIQDVSRDIKVALNKYRAHLRKFYPEQYRQAIARIDEELEELSTSGAAGAYLTPYAFRKKGQKPNDKVYKELGYKLAKEGTCGYDRDKNGKKLKGPGGLGEGDTYEKMAAKGKKAGNLKQGTVRKRLNIPKGKKIPLSKINKEISRIKKMENPSEKNKKYLKALNLSKTLKTTTNVDEGSNNPGASLGPGPKAGPDGVSNSAYTKQFKYKLVPKTKDGTYVQKGSGMIVKNLF